MKGALFDRSSQILSTNVFYVFLLLHFQDLGLGWEPAILNTSREILYIRQAQRGFSDAKSFWIGGSTNVEPYEFILELDSLGSYLLDDSGD